MNIEHELAEALAAAREVRLGILFGSMAVGKEGWESDVDLAVAGTGTLPTATKMQLIERVAEVTGRPVDLIDLQAAGGTVLKEVLTKGKVIYCDNRQIYGDLINKMLLHEADMMPYYLRILKERRRRWLAR